MCEKTLPDSWLSCSVLNLMVFKWFHRELLASFYYSAWSKLFILILFCRWRLLAHPTSTQKSSDIEGLKHTGTSHILASQVWAFWLPSFPIRRSFALLRKNSTYAYIRSYRRTYLYILFCLENKDAAASSKASPLPQMRRMPLSTLATASAASKVKSASHFKNFLHCSTTLSWRCLSAAMLGALGLAFTHSVAQKLSSYRFSFDVLRLTTHQPSCR